MPRLLLQVFDWFYAHNWFWCLFQVLGILGNLGILHIFLGGMGDP